MKYLSTLMLAAIIPLGAACTSTGTFDQTKAQEYEQWAELAYSTAKISINLLCAGAPNAPPCNSKAAMTQISNAEVVLDEAFAEAKDEIANAKDMNGVVLAFTTFQKAVAVYASVMNTYGISRGGM